MTTNKTAILSNDDDEEEQSSNNKTLTAMVIGASNGRVQKKSTVDNNAEH